MPSDHTGGAVSSTEQKHALLIGTAYVGHDEQGNAAIGYMKGKNLSTPVLVLQGADYPTVRAAMNRATQVCVARRDTTTGALVFECGYPLADENVPNFCPSCGKGAATYA